MTVVHFHCVICGTALTARSDAGGAVKECRACGRHVPVPALAHLERGPAGCAPVFPEEILSVELKFRCTRCINVLCVEVRWEGHEVRCPKCNQRLRVPRWSHPRPDIPAEPVAPLESNEVPQLSPAEIEFLSGTKPAVA